MKKCRKCSREAAAGRSSCDHCLSLKRSNNKKRRERFIANGACSECGGIRDNPALKLCLKCQMRVKTRQRSRYTN